MSVKISGKVSNVNLHENGGSVQISEQVAGATTPAAAPGAGGARSVNINFTKAEAAGFAALVGKPVVVEVTEVTA